MTQGNSLPRNATTLPADVKQAVWESWPRKADVHIMWRLRPRQIDAYVARKKIRMYLCPDLTLRCPPEDVIACFGMAPPETAEGTPHGAVPVKPEAPIDIEDPVASMFREAVNMLRAADERTLQVLQMLLNPMNAALAAQREAMAELKATNDTKDARIAELESARDQTLREREEAIDNRHLRDLVMAQEMHKETRRGKIVDSFVGQLPIFVAKWTGGTLSDFIGQYTPDEWELLFTTGFVKDEQKAQIRSLIAQAAMAKKTAEERAAKAAAKASAANGAAATPAQPETPATPTTPATGGN
jgi:hypothetical protein